MYEWENKGYQLLLKGSEAADVVDEWAWRNIESDLRIRRAKIRQMFPSCKVNIKDLNR